MKKFFKISGLILATAVLALFLQIFFGQYISAKISNVSFVKRFGLLRPQAPIVLNNVEEVRVSESEDVVVAFNKVKSKLSSVYVVEDGQAKQIASAVNISNDGVFLTAKSPLVGLAPSEVSVVLENGTVGQVTSISLDPASSLAILKADIKDAAPASFSDIGISQGRRVFFAGQGTEAPFFESSFIRHPEEISGVVSANLESRTLGVENPQTQVLGMVMVNMEGDVSGVWDGAKVVPSTVIKTLYMNYFANGGNILRPSFGFNYRYISKVEAQLEGKTSGALVSKLGEAPAIEVSGPAFKAGLLEGDIIVQIGSTKIEQSTHLETYIDKLKAGDKVELKVVRGSKELTLSLTAGELK